MKRIVLELLMMLSVTGLMAQDGAPGLCPFSGLPKEFDAIKKDFSVDLVDEGSGATTRFFIQDEKHFRIEGFEKNGKTPLLIGVITPEKAVRYLSETGTYTEEPVARETALPVYDLSEEKGMIKAVLQGATPETTWFAKDTRFPLKVEISENGTKVIQWYKNPKTGPVGDIRALPAGAKKADSTQD
jgi:hypothetical protein